ncbi:MAG: hypothetical protein AAGJ37_08110 [Pseudomonadota bacterium]
MSVNTFHFYLRCLTTIEKQIVPRNEANNRFINEYVKSLQGKYDSAKEAMDQALERLKVFSEQRENILNDMSYVAIVMSQMFFEEGQAFEDEALWWREMAKHQINFKHELLVIHWKREREPAYRKAINISLGVASPYKE